MSQDQTTQVLKKIFEKHRIVFWYDTNKELRAEYESLSLPGIEKVEFENNQYALKYRLLREETKQKFLLYYEGPEPPYLENWLLDIQLANSTFSADQISMWLAYLGLRQEFYPLIKEHAEFCKADSRLEKLKNMLSKDDTHNAIRTKMMAVCVKFSADARIESILEILLSELANDRDEKINLINRCALEPFLWERMKLHFGYASEVPSIKDFAFCLFEACYAISLEEDAVLTQDALVFLKRWKDSVRHKEAFEKLSEEYAQDPALERDLQNRDIRDLIDLDFFKLIDQKILSELVYQVVERTISAGECAKIIWNRRTTHWYEVYAHTYEAVYYSSQFIAALDKADLRMVSMSDGINKYQSAWYQLDQYYRKFIYHVRASKLTDLLKNLIDQIENLYSNNFLLAVNDNWQQVLDQVAAWDAMPIMRQDAFFDHWVGEYIKKKSKVAVIISDAMRYEIAQELTSLIEQEDRYTATLEPMLSMLPSYTQLGMASLLPHQELSVQEDGSVEIDGFKTSSKEYRDKVLKNAFEDGAAAIRSEDFLTLSREELGDLFRDHNIVYIYHNQIDAAGDTLKTEGRVFDACEDAINELLEILKKYYQLSYTFAIITTDHGFIYQNVAIDESDFSGIDIEGAEIQKRNRRFVIGKGLKQNPSAKIFQADQLGLSGDYEIAIPKSINRLRVKGSGSRYVHGGASLQEIVLPVVSVHKKKKDDVKIVDVDIIASSTAVITSGQIAVSFYQKDPVSAKVQARKLRAGIYSQEGELISNPEELFFDFTSDNPREREVKVRFVLSSKADDVNNQTVYLKLEAPRPGTTRYQEYISFPYQLRRSFTSDF